ncbi:MAG: hypothetical protein K2K84_02060 [Muribaculaceae bacterium]|nr:hypothetical protein [Muribaculaceae bacterium]
MKKLIFGALFAGAVCAGLTSCGAGEQGEVNTDSVFTAEFCDTFTTVSANQIGIEIARYISATEDMTGKEFDRQEFLKGLQMITGSAYSDEFIEGVQYGCNIALTINSLKAQGLDLNRDELLRNVRRLVMADSISQADHDYYISESERMFKQLNSILDKREQMRAGIKVVPAVPATEPEFTPEMQALLNGDETEVVEEVTETVVEPEELLN